MQRFPQTSALGMRPAFRSLVVVFLLATIPTAATSLGARGQEPSGADAQEGVRRQALLAIEDLLIDTRDFDDRALTARVKAQVADLLWAVDAQRAAQLLEGAFDDASAIDEKSGTDYLSIRRTARAEVIRIASLHDQKLASRLIERLAEKGDESRQNVQKGPITSITDRGAMYLDSASALLEAGDQAKAIELARLSIKEGRSGQFLWFLGSLKSKDQAASDALFRQALNALRQGPADPNDILVLGMWLFYPNSQSSGSMDGGLQVAAYGMDFAAAPAPPTALLIPYLGTAADVLLRFVPQPGLPESITAVELKRFALMMLLPVFDRYLPSRSAALRMDLNRLGQPPAGLDVSKGLPGANPAIELTADGTAEDAIARIERIVDSQKRDPAFLQAARDAMARPDFEQARAIATHISDAAQRRLMLEMIGYNVAMKAIRSGAVAEAEETAASQLTEERQAVVYLELARISFRRGDRTRAEMQLASAQAGAEKIDNRTQRASAFIHLASGVADQDVQRAFGFAEWAVKEIDRLDKFRASGEPLMFVFRFPGGSTSSTGFGTSTSLISVVPHLARSDFARTILLLRSIRLAESRALSIIAACRAVNPTAKKPADTKKPEPSKKLEDKKPDKSGL